MPRSASELLRRVTLLCCLACLVAAALWLHPIHAFRAVFLNETAYRANRLFKNEDPNFDAAVYRLAQRIEWGETLDAKDLTPLTPVLNQRHGEGITLLFHAVASGNTSAVDALLAAGADPGMTDRAAGSVRNFAYVLTLPGGNLLDLGGINTMIASYLRYGGDPNAEWGEDAGNRGNLAHGLALIGNLEGLAHVIKAGGNPWRPTWNEGARNACAVEILAENAQYAALDALIDQGMFTNRTQAEIHNFLVSLGSYAQRRDERSREIQRIAMRVLKRNPDYIETDSIGLATHRIFQGHWQDPQPGIIPWDVILSDAVR